HHEPVTIDVNAFDADKLPVGGETGGALRFRDAAQGHDRLGGPLKHNSGIDGALDLPLGERGECGGDGKAGDESGDPSGPQGDTQHYSVVRLSSATSMSGASRRARSADVSSGCSWLASSASTCLR